MTKVLYIHGMGGGGDSRIPSILNDAFHMRGESVTVVVRTYDFDPEVALKQIDEWVRELRPRLVIGESLGCLHALRIEGVPHILISPALNAPFYFEALAWLSLIPGVTWAFDRIYRPRDGDRQSLHFVFRTLRKYIPHRNRALAGSPRNGGGDSFLAFIGMRDHYRRSGIVSVSTWKKYYGNSFILYDGTHFTEDEFIHSLVVPEIIKILSDKK